MRRCAQALERHKKGRMVMKKCKKCAAVVISKTESCPHCGASLKAKPMGCGGVLAVVVLGIIILGAFGSIFNSKDISGVSQSSPASSGGETARSHGSISPPEVASKNSDAGDGDNPPKSNKVSQSAWNVHPFKDELDGHKIWNANSEEEASYGQLSWPSSDVTAHLTVGNDRGDIFVVLVFSQSPNLVGGQTENGYSIYKLPISFDGKAKKLTVTQKWGSPNLYATYPNWFIENMKSAKEVIIRVPWYQQAAMYFKFDVSGLGKAIKRFK